MGNLFSAAPTRAPGRSWWWNLGTSLALVGGVAFQLLAETPARETIASTTGDTRFVAPLDRQADTGALPITQATLPARTRTYEIVLASGDEADHRGEKVFRVAQGTQVAYRWTVSGLDNPEEFYADVYGHTEPGNGFAEHSYRQGGGLSDSGSFSAPLDGYLGWFFKNDSAHPITVTLEVAGLAEALTNAETDALEAVIEQHESH